MKHITWVIPGLLVLLASFQKNQNADQSNRVDYQKEEEAIKAVIIAESRAFWSKDYNAWADTWAHEDFVRVMGWWKDGGVTVHEGWDEVSAPIKAMIEKYPEPNEQKEVNRNYNIRISKDMAWVTFDQFGTDTGEKAFDMPGKAPNTRILEKIDGRWKIVYVGWLLQGDDQKNNN